MWHTLFVILALVFGMAAIIVARRIHSSTASWHEIGAHLLRDIGLAFLVAVAVGYGFEIFQRARENERTIEETFDAAMSNALTRDVWLGVKHQILQKKLMRRDAEVRLRLKRDKALQSERTILAVEFGYDLYNLADEPLDTIVEHELDYQLEVPGKALPRFERIVLDDERGSAVYEGNNLGHFIKQGIAKIPIKLDPRGRSHARIVTERIEVVHAPGSYNLYMTEYTIGVRIFDDECPDDLEMEVRVRPEGTAQQARKAGKAWYLDALLLPGQGIEIKFKPRTR
jgi:hypothetical protein